MSSYVVDRLGKLALIHSKRSASYGEDYKHIGEVLVGLFPRGISLRTEEEFRRFALFMNVLQKVNRYAQCMPGNGHEDSLDDLALYSMLMQECDAIASEPELHIAPKVRA